MQKAKTAGDIPVGSKEADDVARPENPRRAAAKGDNRRHTLYYNASNYDSLAKQFEAKAVYQVVLLGTEYIESTKIGAKPYTTYRLRVTHQNDTKWTTTRRYREFRSLMEKLKSKHGSKVPHGFPPKKILRNMNPLLIDRRHMALQTWLDKVLQEPTLGSCPEVQLFLEETKMEEGLVEVKFEESMVRLDLEKIGYLYKLRNKQWKKRWFILRHGILYKYNSHQDKYPYGQYVWKNAVTVQKLDAGAGAKDKDKHFCFMVTHKRSHHIFAAADEEELQEWMSAIAGEDGNQKLYDDIEGESRSKILGVPLDAIEHRNVDGLPIFLTCLMDYIEATSVGKDDLFTQAPDPVLISQIQEGVLDFELIRSYHAVAGLIQVFLHEMPIPVLTFELRACFIGVCDIILDATKIQILHSLCQVLPPLHYNLLHRLCFFLRNLYNGKESTLDHLCNTFSVLLLRPPKEKEKEEFSKSATSAKLDLTSERALVNEVTRYLILYCDQICPFALDLNAEAFEEGEDELDAFITENEDILPLCEPEIAEAPRKKSKKKKRKRSLISPRKKQETESSESITIEPEVQSTSSVPDVSQKKKKSGKRTIKKDHSVTDTRSRHKDKKKKPHTQSSEEVSRDSGNSTTTTEEIAKEPTAPLQENIGKKKTEDGVDVNLDYLEDSESVDEEYEDLIETLLTHPPPEPPVEERPVPIPEEKLPARPVSKIYDSAELAAMQLSALSEVPEAEAPSPPEEIKPEPETPEINTEEIQEETKEDNKQVIPAEIQDKSTEAEAKKSEEPQVAAEEKPEKPELLENEKTKTTEDAVAPEKESPRSKEEPKAAVSVEEDNSSKVIGKEKDEGPEDSEPDTKDVQSLEESEESESESEGPLSPLSQLPDPKMVPKLGTFSKNAGPMGRKRPTRRFKSPIIIPEFTVITDPDVEPKTAPTPRMTAEQNLMLEMSRLFKQRKK